MERRNLLAYGAAVLAAGGLAGCVSRSPTPGGGNENRTTTRSTTPGTTDRDGTAPDESGTTNGSGAANESGSRSGSRAAEPFRTVEVGSRTGVRFQENNQPHGLRVVNDAEARELALRLAGESGSPTFQETVSFPAGGVLQFELLTPTSYTLTVSVAGGSESVSVPAKHFDCNSSATTVTVGVDGSLDQETASTLVACAGPDRATFTVTDSGCAMRSAGSATITREEDRVAVTGSLRTPNPCYSATLADVNWENGADGRTLDLVVAATEPDRGGVCMDCIGSVEYEAGVAFGGPFALENLTVTVTHAEGEEHREVAAATFASDSAGAGTTTDDSE